MINRIQHIILKFKNFLIPLIFIAGLTKIQAQEISVPIDLQVELIPKILSLNKSFNLDNPNTTINVGILFNSTLRLSEVIKTQIFDHLNGEQFHIKKVKATILPIDVSNVEDLKKYFIEKEIRVLYISPIRGYDISSISQLCRELKIISFTGVSTFIDNNDISVGFILENNKLKITINLESAKAEGANFSSRLLNVSQVR